MSEDIAAWVIGLRGHSAAQLKGSTLGSNRTGSGTAGGRHGNEAWGHQEQLCLFWLLGLRNCGGRDEGGLDNDTGAGQKTMHSPHHLFFKAVTKEDAVIVQAARNPGQADGCP